MADEFGTLQEREGGDGASGLLRVSMHRDGDARIITLDGELDLATIDYLDDALDLAALDDPEVVLVDLRELTFMDSTGLKSLLEADKRCRARGGRLVLVRGGQRTQRILEIAGVGSRFEFVTSPQEVQPSRGGC